MAYQQVTERNNNGNSLVTADAANAILCRPSHLTMFLNSFALKQYYFQQVGPQGSGRAAVNRLHSRNLQRLRCELSIYLMRNANR